MWRIYTAYQHLSENRKSVWLADSPIIQDGGTCSTRMGLRLAVLLAILKLGLPGGEDLMGELELVDICPLHYLKFHFLCPLSGTIMCNSKVHNDKS